MQKPDSNSPDLGFLVRLEEAMQYAQNSLDEYNRTAFPSRPPEFFALELAGEAGELANKEKKIWKGKEVPNAELGEEAADVIIAVMNYANARGVNLGDAVARKVREIERHRVEDSP